MDEKPYYVELALDAYTHRGQCVPYGQLYGSEFIRANYKRSVWRSYYVFDEGLYAFLTGADGQPAHKALSLEYPGLYHIDQIRLDFEKEGDDGTYLNDTISYVRQVVRRMVNELKVREDWIQVWFSGMKGFHVCVPNLFGLEPSHDLPKQLQNSVGVVFEKEIKDRYLDTKPMGGAGLIRHDWSRHQKSRLHKVPLSLDELMKRDASWICDVAANPSETRRGFLLAPMQDYQPVWQDMVVKKLVRTRFGTAKSGISIQHDPTTIVTCMQKLVSDGPVKGHRNESLLRMTSWLRRGGVPEDLIVQALVPWTQPEDAKEYADMERTIRRAYRKGYVYPCQDHVMAAYCDPKCIFYKQKNYTVQVATASQMGRNLQTYFQKVAKQGVGIDLKLLYPSMPKPYRILPGEIAVVTGDTGMGKSALVQNWLVQLGQRAAYLNLEMNENLAFRRQLQIAHGKTKKEVEQFILSATEEELDVFVGEVEHVVFRSIAPKIDEVETMVSQLDPKIVVVDTTDAIEVPEAGNNEMFQLKRVVEELRKIAQRHQIIVICLHHINKGASKALSGESKLEPKRLLSLNDLTGNRANVTKMDHVFAVEGKRDSDVRYLRALKTRDDSAFMVQLYVDWSTFRFASPAFEQDPF